jgi:hypothetical protein
VVLDLDLMRDMIETMRRWLSYQRNECDANLKRLNYGGPESRGWEEAHEHLRSASERLAECESELVRASGYLGMVR